MAKNDITGDEIRSKPVTKAYIDGWNRIFGKKKNKKSTTLYSQKLKNR